MALQAARSAILQRAGPSTGPPSTSASFEHMRACCACHAPAPQAKKVDGTEYKRTSLLDTARGVLRAINATYRQQELDGKTAPPALSLTKDTLLSTTTDSVCRQLSAAGKGEVKQQPAFQPAELAHLIATARSLPPSSFKHTVRKYIWLGVSWGGRASEYYLIEFR